MKFSLSDSELSYEQTAYADSILQSGEALLWAGRPVCKLPKLMLFHSVVLVAGFVFILWQIAGSGFFGMTEKADFGAALLLCLPVLSIPAIVFIVGVGSPLWYLYRLANSFYLITDRRYLAVCKYPLLGFRQQEWTGMPLAVTAEKDGTGDIVMEYRVRKNKGNVSVNPIGLLHIPNIAQVRELMAGLVNVATTKAEEDPAEAAAPKARSAKSGVFFLTLAAGAWAYGLLSALETYENLSSWEKTEGVVTSLERSTSHDRHGSHSTYRACYRFKVNDMLYEGKESVSSNPPAYRSGEKLPVVYNPADPRESDVDSALNLYFKSLGFGGVGMILFLIGCSRFNPLKGLAFLRRRA
ncbi:MAG: DUF3592 domain-containing protein [Akkermansia sp.]|nr:DUF3592 domain-containing protein [Akkermansia sp.]